MSNNLVLTIIADDRPGIVETLADTLMAHDGNWLESAFSRLGGKFAGILLTDIAADQQPALEQALSALAARGIRVSLEPAGEAASDGEALVMNVVGNDRRGIVGEISRLLARHNVNVHELYTTTESAAMSGELLFRVEAEVALPEGLDRHGLRTLLEELSDDLVVELETSPADGH